MIIEGAVRPGRSMQVLRFVVLFFFWEGVGGGGGFWGEVERTDAQCTTVYIYIYMGIEVYLKA